MHKIQISALGGDDYIHVQSAEAKAPQLLLTWGDPLWLRLSDGTIIHAFLTTTNLGLPIQNLEVVRSGSAVASHESRVVNGWSDRITLESDGPLFVAESSQFAMVPETQSQQAIKQLGQQRGVFADTRLVQHDYLLYSIWRGEALHGAVSGQVGSRL